MFFCLYIFFTLPIFSSRQRKTIDDTINWSKTKNEQRQATIINISLHRSIVEFVVAVYMDL